MVYMMAELFFADLFTGNFSVNAGRLHLNGASYKNTQNILFIVPLSVKIRIFAPNFQVFH